MNRREALLLMAAGFGGTIFGSRQMLAAAATAAASKDILSEAARALLNEVGETILPATPDSGGAKAANVAEFMADIVRSFYTESEQTAFVAGLGKLQAASRHEFSGREFLELTAGERHDLLLSLDEADPPPEYYRMIKQLTVRGYFTSEIGATQAMAHVAIPGRYDGVVTIPPGTKAWSS
jgi:hypothetical protein